MDVALSSRGDYAIRAVLDLAQHYGHGPRKAREIARSIHIPKNFLSLILAEFARAGLLAATQGRAGGYELARPPRAISLLEVVELAEGPIHFERCVLRGIPCSSNGTCAAHAAWLNAQQALPGSLARTTFADLARENARRGGTPTAAGARGQRTRAGAPASSR